MENISQKEIGYASECDFLQLQKIFSSPLDEIIISLLKEKKDLNFIIKSASKSGFNEEQTKKRIQNIRASGYLNFFN